MGITEVLGLHVSGREKEKEVTSEGKGQCSVQVVFKRELVKQNKTEKRKENIVKIIPRGGQQERGQEKTFIQSKSYGANYNKQAYKKCRRKK